VVEVTVIKFRQSRQLGSPTALPLLEGDRIKTEPTVHCSEGTLTHRRSTTSINTGGQRGG
jgi:hypothetical protein